MNDDRPIPPRPTTPPPPPPAPRTVTSARRIALLSALDQFGDLLATLDGWVHQLRDRGYTDGQARAIVAATFGWRPGNDTGSADGQG